MAKFGHGCPKIPLLGMFHTTNPASLRLLDPEELRDNVVDDLLAGSAKLGLWPISLFGWVDSVDEFMCDPYCPALLLCSIVL